MNALEVSLNAKRVRIAGAEDFDALTTNVSAVGELGRKTVPARLDDASGDVGLAAVVDDLAGIVDLPEDKEGVEK